MKNGKALEGDHTASSYSLILRLGSRSYLSSSATPARVFETIGHRPGLIITRECEQD